jgi:hypothetical protein
MVTSYADLSVGKGSCGSSAFTTVGRQNKRIQINRKSLSVQVFGLDQETRNA